jgi:cobalt-zinc-cadmium efflux system outer membrane protein
MWKCFEIRRPAAAIVALLLLVGAAPSSASAAPSQADSVGDPSTPVVPIESLLGDPARLAEWIANRHPDVLAANARVMQAEAGVDQSRVIPNPTLQGGVGGLTVGTRSPNTLSYGETINWSVGLTETIELGKRGPRAQAAELRRDASRADARAVLADRLADAREAMARVIYLTERHRVLDERLKSAQNVAALEHVRLDRGDISGIDQDRLELDITAVLRASADNQAELEAARADCSALLLGTCSAGEATMSAIDASTPVQESYPSLEAIVRARPDIQAARLASSAAKSDALLYKRQAIPDPTLGVAYTRDYFQAAGSQPHTISATVAIPLPLFDHGQHLARRAEGVAAEYGYAARGLESRALYDAHALLARRDVLREKLSTLTTNAIPRAVAVLKSSDEAYHRGQLSLTDLLLVRREHASLLLDALDTRYDLFTVRNTLYRTLSLGVPQNASAKTEKK